MNKRAQPICAAAQGSEECLKGDAKRAAHRVVVLAVAPLAWDPTWDWTFAISLGNRRINSLGEEIMTGEKKHPALTEL